MTGRARACEVQIHLLAGFEVILDGQPARGDWHRNRCGDLVKLLALAPGHRLHREQVVDILWSQLDAKAAFANLHKAAFLARRALGADAVVMQRGTVALWPAATLTTDLERFEAAAKQALGRGDPVRCAAVADTYGGDLLPDDPYADWAAEARERARHRHLELLQRAGRWEELAAGDPANEEAHRELMRASAAEGRRHDALRIFERLRDALGDLGLDPSPDTTKLLFVLTHGAPVVAPLQRTTPLFSRERDLARALNIWREGARGRGGGLLVAGEAGIGKTHFCERLLAGVAAEGGATLRGSAYREEGLAPYAPVAEALDRLLAQRPELAEALPGQARRALHRLFGRPPAGGAPARLGRQPVLSAVSRLLAAAANGHGLVLWIDDLHAADEATVELVHYLARMARRERIVVVASYRREELPPVAASVRASLLAGRAAIEIVLGPLPLAATDAIVGRRTGRRATERAVEAIHELAAGNPFFIEELATAVGTDGAIQIPEHLYGTLDARLESLDSGLRAMLEEVAIVGTVFSAEDLAALVGSPERVFAMLDEALRSGFVVEANEGYRFRHGLLREALLAAIPRHRRQRAHSQIAEVLVASGAAAGRIAHHLLAADRGREAVRWLEQAAREAFAIGAVGDARMLTERALEQAPRRTGLLELRAECLFASGDAAVITAYAEAIAAARGGQRRRLRIRQARVALLLGDFGVAEELDGLTSPGGADEVCLLVARGYAAWHRGDVDEAERCAEEARRIGMVEGLVAQLTDVATLRALVAHSRGTWPEQIEADLLDTSGAPQLAAKVNDCYLCVTEIYIYGGQPYERITAFARELRSVAERNGAERGRAFATVLLGEAELVAGHLDEAVARLQEGADLHRRIGSAGGESLALQRLAEAALLRGRADEARALLNRALDLARQSHLLVRHLLPRIYGTMISAAPGPTAALALVDEAQCAITGPAEACRMCAVTLAVPAARACARAGAIDRARAYLDIARRGTMLWRGGAWHDAIAEAEAELAAAERKQG